MSNRLEEILDRMSGIGSQELSEIGLMPLLLVLTVSTTASIFIAYLHLFFYSSRATGSHVQRSFPLLGLSITSIFICLQFSLPLSLGLLGALSVVRFRTPVKEPEEIGFIMLVIASSLACANASFGFLIALLGVAVVALLTRQWARAVVEGTTSDCCLIVTLSEADYRRKRDEVLSLLESAWLRPGIESITTNDQDVVLSLVFRSTSSRQLGVVEKQLREVVEPADCTVLFNRPGRL